MVAPITASSCTCLTRRTVGWGVLAAFGLLPLGAGCTSEPAAPSDKSAPAARPTLVTAHPQKANWHVVIEQPGQIEAFEVTPIYANVTGFVAEVCVDMNAHVKKGECLARMKVPELEEDVKQKTALIAQAQAELELQRKAQAADEANLATTKALVEEARSHQKRTQASLARWAAEHKRIAGLVAKQVLDEQTRDEVRHQFRTAEAECDECQAKIAAALARTAESAARVDKAKAEVQAAQARYRVAQSNEARATAMLQYATLTAPYDGVVSERKVNRGDLLKPATSGHAEPLFTVVRMDRVRIFVEVPETEAAYVHAGTPARVRVHALKDCEIDAAVARISWALNPKTRTLRAEIELPNTDGKLRPGMYAFATLLVDHVVWAVPTTAVQRRDDGTFCYLLKAGKAVPAAVRLGARQGALVEVLKINEPRSDAPGNACWTDLSGNEPIVQDAGIVAATQDAG